MSNAYIVQGGGDPNRIAPVLAGQLSSGDETVNHFASSDDLLMGVVSHDHFHQRVMPRYLEEERLLGFLIGELHYSARLECLRARYPDADQLAIFARLYRDHLLDECLPELNGAFFFAFWDHDAQTLVAANDRFGLYPMYWSHRNGRFCLASRVLCSVLADVVPGDWDLSGAAMLLVLDDMLGETTMVEDVAAFPQATVLRKTGDRLIWRRYWRYQYTGDADGSPAEIGMVLADQFVRSVYRQTRSTNNVAVTLSGGLDSRAIVAAARRSDIAIDTYTWGAPHCLDRQIARRVSQTFGYPHHGHDYQVGRITECLDQSGILAEGMNNYFDCHMATHLPCIDRNMQIVLNGYAGDLLLGGSYLRSSWMGALTIDALADLLFAWRNVGVSETELPNAIADGPDRLAISHLPSTVYRNLLRSTSSETTPDCVDQFMLENRVRRTTSIGTVLLRSRIESAACFFDYDFVDMVLKVRAPLRAEHRVYRHMLAALDPRTLQLQWQRTLLPAGAPVWAALCAKSALRLARGSHKLFGFPDIASRQAPVDMASALRGPLRSWMTDLIAHGVPEASQLLDSAFCSRVWQAHLAGQNHTTRLGAIAALTAFARALEDARRGRPATQTQPTAVPLPRRPR